VGNFLIVDTEDLHERPHLSRADTGWRTVGRRRDIVTDTIGRLLVVLVTAASVQDNPARRQLFTAVAAEHPAIRRARADLGHRNAVVEHGATPGIDVEIVRPRHQGIRRPPPPPGRRAHLRPADEPPPPRPRLRSPPARSDAMVHAAVINLMTPTTHR
jgi:hypothetical protein